MAGHDEARAAFLHQAAKQYDAMVARARAGVPDTLDDMEEQAERQGRELTRRLLAARLAVEE